MQIQLDSSFSYPSLLSLFFETLFFVSSLADWLISVFMFRSGLFYETNFLFVWFGNWFWVIYWVLSFGLYLLIIRFYPRWFLMLSIPSVVHWTAFFHNFYIYGVFS